MKTTPIIAGLTLSVLLSGVPAAAQNPPQRKAAPASAAVVSLKEAKLAALDAWLNSNKSSPERAEGLAEAANLAFEMANWAKAKGYAELYVKEFPKEEGAGEMQLLVGKSFASMPGEEAAARKAFEKAFADAGDDVRAAFQATEELAGLCVILGDIEGAKKAYGDLKDKYAKTEQGLGEHIDGVVAEYDQYGKPPIPIDVLGYDKKPINLDDLKGKVVLIDFWATWCGPCIAELPNVIATYKKHHAQGFEIVGISLDKDESKFTSFLSSHEMPWPQYYDGKFWDNEVSTAYGVKSIPQTYLLDKEGNVRAIGVRGPALARAVERLLAPKEPAKK